jgi:hypothetical protein
MPKEAASFLFNTSTTLVDALGGRDFVWKELLHQQWPSIPPLTFSSFERLFYQLSRSPLLRKYDRENNDSPFEQQQQQQQPYILTPPKLCLDKFALTVTLRNIGDQAVFSHCLSALEMQGLLETGRAELPTTRTSESSSSSSSSQSLDILATTSSAFVHAWDLTTTTSPRVCALNEPNAWIWNDQKHCWQLLTRFVQWTKRGQDLEDRIRRQQQQQDSYFGGLKFQLSIYPRVVVLEIRKRHGRYPDGLFRHYPEVQQEDHHGVGLWHLVDELAGWKEL